MRILDLFCGAGGAAVGYARAGFEVTGVDIDPQPAYPFEFVQADALDCLMEFRADGRRVAAYLPGHGEFDAIHASPPCQRYSAKTRDRDRHPDLVVPVRELLRATGLPFVIENVPGAPLINPVRLCGSAFGLGVRRHRLFESNVPLSGSACHHAAMPKKYRIYDHGRWYLSSVVHVFGTGGGKGREHWQEAMGIDWTNDTDGLREAIPPAYTEYLGRQLREHLAAREMQAA